MKVREVMREPVFCGLDATLAAAVELMRNNGCGFLPIVGEGGNVIGVITDRDICIALGTRNQKPSDVLVKDVMLPKQYTFPKLFTCTPNDDIHCVLEVMRTEKVRRLPVIDHEGGLLGILSMDDIVLQPVQAGENATFRVRMSWTLTRPYAPTESLQHGSGQQRLNSPWHR
jgi:CBS domain-containing protein